MPPPRAAFQAKLFDEPKRLPNGLVYRPNFITEDEEEILLAMIENSPLSPTKYDIKSIGESVLTKRRAVWFSERAPAGLPRWLHPLQGRIAKWLDVPKHRLTSALINEYVPGSGMGWHRDNEEIEHVVGVSLAGWCTIGFRPYALEHKGDVVWLELERRSAYIMQGPVRWEYQHRVMPVTALRYSITFRTALSGTTQRVARSAQSKSLRS